MSDMIRTEVLIVGGGMVGLSLALALARAGIETAVIDRDAADARTAEPFDGRSSAIAQASRRILEGIGAWTAMAGEAQPILDIRVSDGRVGRPAAPLFLHFDHREAADPQNAPAPMGWIVENRLLRAALLRRLAVCRAVELIAPDEVVRIGRDAHRVDVELKSGRSVPARPSVKLSSR